ncbi:hypothetical protein AX16_001321 [Volvariella volvacea WC 439]|nr:hypothetical protein AX16_001321 [Volvariella volvacea WC 439]
MTPQSLATQLPQSFRSLYRLHLRTISAAVLHHRSARNNLRTLWRGKFDEAAGVYSRLVALSGSENQNEGPSTTRVEREREREKCEKWLTEWNKRMDNTLSLLYTSSQSRGLPHKLTRNLHLLKFYTNADAKMRQRQVRRQWNPHLPPDSSQYKPQPLSRKEQNKIERTKRWMEFDDRVWKDVEEVVRMAEGRDRLVLGKI